MGSLSVNLNYERVQPAPASNAGIRSWASGSYVLGSGRWRQAGRSS